MSPALVYPFMRSVMEAPFPAPGCTITVRSYLPGAGDGVRQPTAPCAEVRQLRKRPAAAGIVSRSLRAEFSLFLKLHRICFSPTKHCRNI